MAKMYAFKESVAHIISYILKKEKKNSSELIALENPHIPCPTVLILLQNSAKMFLNVSWSERKAETNALQPSFLTGTPNCD